MFYGYEIIDFYKECFSTFINEDTIKKSNLIDISCNNVEYFINLNTGIRLDKNNDFLFVENDLYYNFLIFTQKKKKLLIDKIKAYNNINIVMYKKFNKELEENPRFDIITQASNYAYCMAFKKRLSINQLIDLIEEYNKCIKNVNILSISKYNYLDIAKEINFERKNIFIAVIHNNKIQSEKHIKISHILYDFKRKGNEVYILTNLFYKTAETFYDKFEITKLNSKIETDKFIMIR
jgi:hypothetical protein